MRRVTRRRALRAGGALLGAFAGCIGGPNDGTAGSDRTTRTDATTTTATATGTETETETTTTSAGGASVAWRRDVGRVTAGPVVEEDTAYLGAGGALLALAPDGTERWRYDAGAAVRQVILADDAVYLASGDRAGPNLSGATVHAVERGGEGRWTHEVEGMRTPELLGVVDGALGVGLRNDYLEGTGEATFALETADGSERWRVETGDVRGGAVGHGAVYVAEYDEATAVDAADGEKRWSREQQFADAPRPFGDRALLAADELRALDPASGEAAWVYGEDLDLAGAAVVDGVAYTAGEVVAAVGRDGAERWRYDTGGVVGVHRDGVLFGDGRDALFALTVAGEERWTVPEKPAEHFSLAAATEGVVAGSTEGTVHAYDAATGDPAYTFSVDSRHARGLGATADRLLVAGESTLYALAGTPE